MRKKGTAPDNGRAAVVFKVESAVDGAEDRLDPSAKRSAGPCTGSRSLAIASRAEQDNPDGDKVDCNTASEAIHRRGDRGAG